MSHGLVLADGSRTLSKAYARYLIECCQRFLAVEGRLPAAHRPAHRRAAALVREALQRGDKQVLSCFAAPAVGTPLQCLALRDELPAFAARIDAAAAAIVPHLLLEMALRRLIPDGASVLWEHGAPRLGSLAIGGELVPPARATALRFTASHCAAIDGAAELARLPLDPEAMRRAVRDGSAGFRFERCCWRSGDVAQLTAVDHNPIAAFEAHPDKAGNHVDLGGRTPEA
jgi:hypothetical protein